MLQKSSGMNIRIYIKIQRGGWKVDRQPRIMAASLMCVHVDVTPSSLESNRLFARTRYVDLYEVFQIERSKPLRARLSGTGSIASPGLFSITVSTIMCGQGLRPWVLSRIRTVFGVC